jgi:hypothetical protein
LVLLEKTAFRLTPQTANASKKILLFELQSQQLEASS